VRELRELEPVITAKSATAKLALSPTDAPVEFATRELNGALYLLAANKSGRAQSVRFSAATLSGKKVKMIYEERPAAFQGDTLQDQFAPYGVHVYRIEQ